MEKEKAPATRDAVAAGEKVAARRQSVGASDQGQQVRTQVADIKRTVPAVRIVANFSTSAKTAMAKLRQ